MNQYLSLTRNLLLIMPAFMLLGFSSLPGHRDIEVGPIAEAPEPVEDKAIAQETKPMVRVVKATAYNALASQTDSTPEICAWGDRIRPGIIAVSRDLEGLGLTRGQEVHIEGYGKMIVLDRMHKRKRNQIDIFMEKYEDAIEFGVQELVIRWNAKEEGGEKS